MDLPMPRISTKARERDRFSTAGKHFSFGKRAESEDGRKLRKEEKRDEAGADDTICMVE